MAAAAVVDSDESAAAALALSLLALLPSGVSWLRSVSRSEAGGCLVAGDADHTAADNTDADKDADGGPDAVSSPLALKEAGARRWWTGGLVLLVGLGSVSVR